MPCPRGVRCMSRGKSTVVARRVAENVEPREAESESDGLPDADPAGADKRRVRAGRTA